ncbi:hypothetical protein DF268_07275 [Streptomyces sp. V2]|uniref:hypothetical protein n=1 Tax=Streptomyces TaxID=1883 RepID=UPI0006EBA0DB|nr:MULTISPECIES: hypothetical protein [Streptomyces]PWG14339.1 hypothetical protein DF268_07275 [Streptomyces sp. V2]
MPEECRAESGIRPGSSGRERARPAPAPVAPRAELANEVAPKLLAKQGQAVDALHPHRLPGHAPTVEDLVARYLSDRDLQREIEQGLTVVAGWRDAIVPMLMTTIASVTL